jgi:hypothetical protein
VIWCCPASLSIGVQEKEPVELMSTSLTELFVKESDTAYVGVPVKPVATVLKVIGCPASIVEEGEGD